MGDTATAVEARQGEVRQGGAPQDGLAVGRLGERIPGVRRIAVLRGGGLGDLMFAFPAIDALAAAYPEAEITLLGTPLHRALLTGRGTAVDETVVLPVAPGIRSGVEDAAATEAFFEDMRGRGFDLAVQVHGGGRNSNPFLRRIGAGVTVGLQTPDAEPLDRVVPYLYYQYEPARALEVAGLVGAPPVVLEARIPVLPEERERAEALLGDRVTVVVHPGATDPRRRWPAESFGALAARLAVDGVQTVVVGDGDDAHLGAEVVAAAEAAGAPAGSVRSLAGELTIGDLAGVLARADVFVGNDSGPRHLAQAVGAPTASVFWFGNVINAGPLDRGRHRVRLAFVTTCPVCGVDVTQVGWTAERCEHDPSFVATVTVDEVEEDVRALITATSPRARA